MHEIEPRLYIGSATDACSADSFDFIVNVTQDIPLYSKQPYIRVPVDDDPGYSPILFSYLPDATKAIHDYLAMNKTVLVHCFAGRSRSATVIAAYLMSYRGLSKTEAIDFIRTKKPETFFPYVNFDQALDAWATMIAP